MKTSSKLARILGTTPARTSEDFPEPEAPTTKNIRGFLDRASPLSLRTASSFSVSRPDARHKSPETRQSPAARGFVTVSRLGHDRARLPVSARLRLGDVATFHVGVTPDIKANANITFKLRMVNRHLRS